MSDPRQRIIIKVFRKYSHALGPDVLDFLEGVLDKHEIADEDVEYSIDLIAKEYNKQDDAAMKVSVVVLERVYQLLQGSSTTASSIEQDILDVDAHIFVVNAFEMPQWNWSSERSTFEQNKGALTLTGSAESRVNAMRNRYNIIKQVILRNDHFSPSTIPSRDREHLLTLRSTKQLLGRAGERFLLFGMLAHSKEGKLCLEDHEGSVQLDFSQLDQPSEGLFMEGAFALIEGDYTDEATFVVIAIGHPPCENRETARSIYGHIDFLGKGATTPQEDARYAVRIEQELSDLNFFVLSDVWLDHPATLEGIRKMFDNCIEVNFIPKVIVLCGNFTTRDISPASVRDAQKYQDNFTALGDLIASYPLISRSTHFVLVPGPLDPTMSTVLPRRSIPSTFTGRLKSKVPRLQLASNPCRIRFFNQEIVIFRENMMGRMLRNLVGVKPDVRNDDLKRYLVQTVLDQSHLSPLAKSVQPVHSEFDHALRLYPLPTAVVLADKYEQYQMTYEGCHVFNPGIFVGNSYGFSAYNPSRRESEASQLDFEWRG